MEKIIGRETEQIQLKKILQSKDAELVAIYGRRRVGKTFLIRNFFDKELLFELSGIHNATLDQQLENFTMALSKSVGFNLARPSSWLQAFNMLENFLTPSIKKQKKVIFFDEFPWINSPRSGFLQAFENFWNVWASRQNNIVVVLCGSAAAWMIQNVINNRGGLHNRVTSKIRLLPFTINEAAGFLKENKIKLNEYQILQLYMVMGGIPQYMKEIMAGESATQAIDRICFTKDGFLHEEFKNLFRSIFDDFGNHIAIVRALAKKGKGLTRTEIIEACDLSSGGGTTQLLEELTESGFISSYIPFDRTAKDNIYRLTDEYAHFYLKFIEGSRIKGKGAWATFSTGQSYKSWSGFAFENICMKHEHELKRALGIENVHTETSVWRYHAKKGEQGAQIDLLIDRQDMCINICEMKFSTEAYEITKGYAKELENKLKVFRENTKTRKTLFVTMVTTFGIKNIGRYAGLVQNQITIDALFK
ncbi:MAG TPA: ATP-binding protein [Chitinophagaceae bacterium]|nr:ATP-binding protein [Chitinophagaceae bacterium]